MKLLAKEISHDNRKLLQSQRKGNVAMYEILSEQGIGLGYEVIRITVDKERERFGRIIPCREIYPSDSKFGTLAFSFGKDQKSEAWQRFDIFVLAEEEDLTPVAVSTVLRTEFRHSGRTYTQVKREGQVALYKLSGAGFEVMVIRLKKANILNGYSYPDREVMPDISLWGTFGWSYLGGDLAGAERRYQSLLPKMYTSTREFSPREWGEQSISTECFGDETIHPLEAAYASR
jgi:hypothetical protein